MPDETIVLTVEDSGTIAGDQKLDCCPAARRRPGQRWERAAHEQDHHPQPAPGDNDNKAFRLVTIICTAIAARIIPISRCVIAVARGDR